MNSEIEAKFLRVNHDEVRAKLVELGAQCEKPMRQMLRVTIGSDYMRSKRGYVRVRDEGDKITVTYKQFDEQSVDGAKEIEFEVSDFEAAVAMFEAVGLPYESFQESRRETWRLDDVEIMLDEWPWLDTYIEIEGMSEAHIQDVAKKLGLKWEDAVFGSVMAAYYAQYPHLGPTDMISTVRQVKFNSPLPEFLQSSK